MPVYTHILTDTSFSCPSSAWCVKKRLDQGNHSLSSFRLPGRSGYLFKPSRPLFKPCLDSDWKVASLNPSMVQQPHCKKNSSLVELHYCQRARHSISVSCDKQYKTGILITVFYYSFMHLVPEMSQWKCYSQLPRA